MKKLLIFLCVFCLSCNCYADYDFIMQFMLAYGNYLHEYLNIQRDILNTSKSIEKLMQSVDKNMTSHSGWGAYQFKDHQSYGKSADDWISIMKMAEDGQGSGQLGTVLSQLAKEFPYQSDDF